MAPPKKPVTIRGVEYPSITEAAEALGLDKSTISYARSLGTLDRVGLREKPPKRKAITIKGVTYSSQNAAAKALGVGRGTVQRAAKRGTLDNIGSRYRAILGHQLTTTPITIRGVEYPSHTIAAEALGVQPATISRAARYGKLDRVGFGKRRSK